jgi:hypothetical protein
VVSKEIRLEVNSDKNKYIVMPRDYNSRPRHNMKVNNRSFKILEGLKYLGTTLILKNSIREEIRSRLNSGNMSYHWVQKVLSTSLLSRNLKIDI